MKMYYVDIYAISIILMYYLKPDLVFYYKIYIFLKILAY